MSELYQNKYRISSTRLQTWDYRKAGMYFVTICTANRECYFGNVVDTKMQLSQIGRIASSEWIKTVELRPDMNLELGEFVVMPNHFHGIIVIGDNEYNRKFDPNQPNQNVNQNSNSSHRFGPQSKNLASIMRGYKSSVTTYARKNGIAFGWQGRYHDHIIRSMEEYHRISEYIINNPARWKDDRFYDGRNGMCM